MATSYLKFSMFFIFLLRGQTPRVHWSNQWFTGAHREIKSFVTIRPFFRRAERIVFMPS